MMLSCRAGHGHVWCRWYPDEDEQDATESGKGALRCLAPFISVSYDPVYSSTLVMAPIRGMK